MTKHIPPTFDLDSFYCPHCNAFTQQRWFPMYKATREHASPFYVAQCIKGSCQKYSFWKSEDNITGEMVYPIKRTSPLPTSDMPPDVKKLYEEARDIAQVSPRGAAALLRLALQVLMPHLGQEGKHLDRDIGKLVEQGLSERIQQALDGARVIGNNMVHPGEIILEDDTDSADVLFRLLNIIVEKIITDNKLIDEVFEKLPSGVKNGIEERDKRKNNPQED